MYPAVGSAAEVDVGPGRDCPTDNIIPVFIDYKLKKRPLSECAWFWGWACLDNAALCREGGVAPSLFLEFINMILLKPNIDNDKNCYER